MVGLDRPALVLPSVLPPLLARFGLLFLLSFFFEAAFVPTDDFGIPTKVGSESLEEEIMNDSIDWPWESSDLKARAPRRTLLTRPGLARLFKTLRTVMSVVPIIRAR